MANSASLLLPGSNLTNLLVLARDDVSGAVFAARMAPAWLAAVVATAGFLALRYRREFLAGREQDMAERPTSGHGGAVATVAVAVLVVGLRSPALSVLGVGIAAVGFEVASKRLRIPEVVATLDLSVLTGLFGIAVGLGTLAGTWSGPSDLMATANSWETAVIGVLGAVAVNNLPAAVLFSARLPAHPRALLVGLDLGPNLAVTGSLSALLWFRAARASGVRPSLVQVTRIGIVMVPLSIAVALAALALFAPSKL
jgi:arsenical pump membrane protein